MAPPLRRLAAVAVAALLLPAAGLAAGSVHSWAQPQIKLVTKRGIFAGSATTFDGTAPLTEGALVGAVATLTGTTPSPASDPSAPASIEELDRSLVDALGLGDSAYRFRLAARAAGITPPRRFGTEVVARLLGLRLNHPAGQDELELQPQQTATRAEAAYSFAQILRFSAGREWWQDRHSSSASAATDFATSWEVERAKEASQSFQLPSLTAWQRRIIAAAFSYVG